MREDQLQAIIAQAIGQEEAQKAVEAIMRHWGGCREKIPKGLDGQRARRDQEIRRLFRQGVDIAGLSERFGVSEKTVERVLGG